MSEGGTRPADGGVTAIHVSSQAATAPDLRQVGAHRDYWYPLAWADELKAGRTLGRRFAGEPIVLYRGAGGQVYALEDRCAHRQVPLHLGVVQG
ncbi:MAG: Rieske 2Fe-2S domain-containing protein, partial [Steroidobacteraceae bacterium]